MTVVKSTFSLSHLDRDWINEIIASGEYVSNSEYVRDLIRKDKEQRTRIKAIRAALIEGEESGTSDRTPDDIINAVIEKRRSNGTL